MVMIVVVVMIVMMVIMVMMIVVLVVVIMVVMIAGMLVIVMHGNYLLKQFCFYYTRRVRTCQTADAPKFPARGQNFSHRI